MNSLIVLNRLFNKRKLVKVVTKACLIHSATTGPTMVFLVGSSLSHVWFILVLIMLSMFLRLYAYEFGIFHANRIAECLMNQSRTKGEGWLTTKLVKAAPQQYYCWPSQGGTCFCFLGCLCVVCFYAWL